MTEHHDKITAFTGANMLDGKGNLIENGTLLMEGKHILAVGGADEIGIPNEAETINLNGKTLMPGLIDSHLHLLGISSMNQVSWVVDEPHLRTLRAGRDAWRCLDAGYTTIRDAGSTTGIYVRNAIEEGAVVGPRVIPAGRAISQTAGHGDWHFMPIEWGERLGLARVADGVAEVRKATREQLREGAEMLKIFTTGGVMSEKDSPEACQYSLPEIRAFVEEAHNFGVRTGTHAQGTKGIKNAIEAGVDNIDHAMFLDDAVIEMMLKKSTTIVATLAIVQKIVSMGRAQGVMEGSVRKAERVQGIHIESIKKAYEAGITIGAGTDYLSAPSTPMGDNADELLMLVEKLGLTPMQAITCATSNNAVVLGLQDKIGTLEPGKLADLLVVKGDPLQDISVLQQRENILKVYKEGVLMPRLVGELRN